VFLQDFKCYCYLNSKVKWCEIVQNIQFEQPHSQDKFDFEAERNCVDCCIQNANRS